MQSVSERIERSLKTYTLLKISKSTSTKRVKKPATGKPKRGVCFFKISLIFNKSTVLLLNYAQSLLIYYFHHQDIK